MTNRTFELKNRTLFHQICVLFALLVIGYLLCLVPIGIIITILKEKTGVPESEMTALMKFAIFLQNLVVFILPAWIFTMYVSNSASNYIGIRNIPSLKKFILTFCAVITLIPFISALTDWNESITFPSWLSELEASLKDAELAAQEQVERFLCASTVWGWLLSILLAGVITGIGEEFFFRGAMQNMFYWNMKNKLAAVLFTAFLFSAFHLQFYGLIPRFLLGAIFGLFYIWTGSIWIPVFAHFLNNSIAVLCLYIKTENIQTPLNDIIINSKVGLPVALASLIAGGFFIYLIYRERDNESSIKL